MRLKHYILQLIILAVFIAWDSYSILSNGSLKGFDKSLHVGLLVLCQMYYAIYSSQRTWNTWLGVFVLIIPIFAASWIIKDISLGLILHGQWDYLGTGAWDTFLKQWPYGYVLGFKLMVLFFSSRFINIQSINWIKRLFKININS